MHCFAARPRKLTDFFEFKGVGISCPSWEWSEIYKRWLFIQSPGSKRLSTWIYLWSTALPKTYLGMGGQTAEFSNFWFLIFLSLPRNSLLCTDSPRDDMSALVWFSSP